MSEGSQINSETNPIEEANRPLIEESQNLQAEAQRLNSQERALKAPRFLKDPNSPMSPAEDSDINVAGLSSDAIARNQKMVDDARNLQSNPVQRENIKTQGGLRSTLSNFLRRNK